ncbi:pro-resilin [Helicoverpa armigera]|uniref:pro-resilin n=1 Tax=Helicoverpa armigera TaxID=29058 RepID=UPI003082E244
MVPSVRRMWLSSIVCSTLFVMAMSAGNEYLPPSKGYNYEPPSIPFPTNNNGNKQPTPPPYRPTTPPRPYLPPNPQPTPGPGPSPTPGPHDHPHDHHHHDHDHGNGNGNHDHGDHHHHEPGMPFDFSYQVAEDGNDYSHNAISDGDITRGEYRVALPDGRTQIVKYTADWKNGFNAEVTYEGEARYPDQPAGGYGSGNTGNGYGSGSTGGNGYPSGSGGSGTGGQAYVPPSQGGGYQY